MKPPSAPHADPPVPGPPPESKPAMVASVVIVGAGEAGARAASTLRDRGFGGDVTLIGDEAHGPYERPPLSKAVMTAERDASAPPLILDARTLAAKAVTHVAGTRVLGIDRAARRVVLESGRSLPYDKLLLATGAGPRRLSAPGATDANVLYLRTFADALALRAGLTRGGRVAVIGGGFIGLEIAASAIARGCRVTVLETAPRILMRGVPAEVADALARAHRAAGVDLRTGAEIAAVDRRGEERAVILGDGTAVVCDAVVAGIGAVPETRLAENCGLAIENGVRVDGTLRTEDSDIYAAGDCCSFPHALYGGRRIRLEAWRNAQDQGHLAAANMLGGAETYAAVPWFWSDQYDHTLQVAGLPDEGTRTVERRGSGGARLHFHLAVDGRLVAVSALGPNGLIARDVKLAEMLIAGRSVPDPVALGSPEVKLRSLLR